MTPVPATPLDQVDTLDLLREYDARLVEHDCLGVRTRIADLEAEIRNRASYVDLTEPVQAVDDDACPDDPDGLHHVTCGCDTSDVFA